MLIVGLEEVGLTTGVGLVVGSNDIEGSWLGFRLGDSLTVGTLDGRFDGGVDTDGSWLSIRLGDSLGIRLGGLDTDGR